MSQGPLLLAFYGDDFTGSAATMEVLASAGVRTALFLEPPGREALARYPGLEAVGVAGMSRTFSPAQMEGALPPVFERLRALGPGIVHYKICSTFDSSPEVGSIGKAIDLGQAALRSPWVPLVVAAPAINRWCVFGNLFAAAGGEVVRLDRHPTMSVHPVTPMDEADLRVHLGKQTRRPIGVLDLLALGAPDAPARLSALRAGGAEIVLFDVLDEPRLAVAGRLVWENRGSQPLFAVGSQGLEYALVAHFRAAGRLPADPAPARIAPVDQLLVVSGSCSPDTDAQIAHALERGFVGLDAEVGRLLDPAEADIARAQVVGRALGHLGAGDSVVLYSARGPRDPRIARGRGGAVGEVLGRVLREIVERHRLARVLLAGGDTSGHGTRALGVEALEALAAITPGAPLCRARAPHPAVDGLELILKGGQMGRVDLFERAKKGSMP